MTMEEKLEMYKEKKAFIDGLNNVFETRPKGSSVVNINYEVYTKEIARDENIYRSIIEFVVLTFTGGGKSAKVVSGNSNTANFRVIGTMLDGGHYEENMYYKSVLESDYTRII